MTEELISLDKESWLLRLSFNYDVLCLTVKVSPLECVYIYTKQQISSSHIILCNLTNTVNISKIISIPSL